LIETLIAIFVSAIGLLALLALFPIGAVSMAQAIKDGRCAQASINATATARFQNLTSDSTVTGAFSSPVPAGAWPSFPSGYDGPSYPVYVDPLGTTLPGGATAVDKLPTPFSVNPGIPRVSPAYASPFSQYLQFFTLLDDVTFTPDGRAGTRGIVERTGRYSWAYLLQQPNVSYPSVVNATVVVYSERSQATLGENSYYVDFVQGSNTVTIFLNQLQTSGQEKPHLRPGGWILDSTTAYQDPGINANAPQPDPHGIFYRVINVTETFATDPFLVAQPALLLELQTNISKSSYTNPARGIYEEGVLTIMDNVAEVFNKGPQ
jgi:hypothetical protein